MIILSFFSKSVNYVTPPPYPPRTPPVPPCEIVIFGQLPIPRPVPSPYPPVKILKRVVASTTLYGDVLLLLYAVVRAS